jgi:hypothetical protein
MGSLHGNQTDQSPSLIRDQRKDGHALPSRNEREFSTHSTKTGQDQLAGLLDFCIFAPLFGRPFSGPKIRASH